jgi:hypothetical protein
MPDDDKELKRYGVALPTDLSDYIEAESERHVRSRNQQITYMLREQMQLERATRLAEGDTDVGRDSEA